MSMLMSPSALMRAFSFDREKLPSIHAPSYSVAVVITSSFHEKGRVRSYENHCLITWFYCENSEVGFLLEKDLSASLYGRTQSFTSVEREPGSKLK